MLPGFLCHHMPTDAHRCPPLAKGAICSPTMSNRSWLKGTRIVLRRVAGWDASSWKAAAGRLQLCTGGIELRWQAHGPGVWEQPAAQYGCMVVTHRAALCASDCPRPPIPGERGGTGGPTHHQTGGTSYGEWSGGCQPILALANPPRSIVVRRLNRRYQDPILARSVPASGVEESCFLSLACSKIWADHSGRRHG